MVWFAFCSRETPTVDDQVMEMIRENPSAEVLAPGPGGAATKESPEVFRIDEPARDPKRSKR